MLEIFQKFLPNLVYGQKHRGEFFLEGAESGGGGGAGRGKVFGQILANRPRISAWCRIWGACEFGTLSWLTALRVSDNRAPNRTNREVTTAPVNRKPRVAPIRKPSVGIRARTPTQELTCATRVTKAVAADSAAIEGGPCQNYQRHNVLYLKEGVSVVRSGLSKYQTLNIVADEARCSNAQVLAAFVSAPVMTDCSFGFMAPLQIMPDISVDFDEHGLDFRISSAQIQAAENEPSKKPKADPLVATWNVCLSLNNCLQSTLGHGLQHFAPSEPMLLLHEASEVGSSCSYRKSSRFWYLEHLSDEGLERRRFLPGFGMCLLTRWAGKGEFIIASGAAPSCV